MTIYYVDGDGGGSDTSPYETWAKATDDIQVVIDLVAAGDTVYCKGRQDVDVIPAAPLVFDGVNGTWDLPIKFIGCDIGTTNEPPESTDYSSGDRYIMSVNGAAAQIASAVDMHYVWLINMQFQDAGSTFAGLVCTAASSYWLFVNCRFTNNGGEGVKNGHLFDYGIFKQCMFDLNNIGFDGVDYLSNFVACRFSSNTTVGISGISVGSLVGCIFEGNTDGGGIALDAAVLLGCTFAEHVEADAFGWSTDGSLNTLFLGCRFTGNYDGLKTAANREAFLDYCYFENDNTDITATETVWHIPDSTNTAHTILAGSDTGYGYETGEYNLDPDEASYFNEPLVVPSS